MPRLSTDTNEYIDRKAVRGLTGTQNSLSYRVHEAERHMHSGGRWFGVAGTPIAETHAADRLGDGVDPFRIDGGNLTWGDWTLIIGSEDTPCDAGKVYFDPHLMMIADSEQAKVYFVQFARGDSGAAGYAAGNYTELAVDLTSKAGGTIIEVQSGRAPVESKIWARCLCLDTNTGWLDFYIGVHEYEG